MTINKSKISFLRVEKLQERYGEKHTQFFTTFTEQAHKCMQSGVPSIAKPRGNLKLDLEAPDRYLPFGVLLHQKAIKKGDSLIYDYLDLVLEETPLPAIVSSAMLIEEHPEVHTSVSSWDGEINPILWVANDILLNRHIINRYPHLIISTFEIDNIQVDKLIEVAPTNMYIENEEFDAIVCFTEIKPEDERYHFLSEALSNNNNGSISHVDIAIHSKSVGGYVTRSDYMTFSVDCGKIKESQINEVQFPHLPKVIKILQNAHKTGVEIRDSSRTDLLTKLNQCKSPSKKKRIHSRLKFATDKIKFK